MQTAPERFAAEDGLDGPAADTPRPSRCRPHTKPIGAQAIRLTRYNQIAVLEWLGPQGRLIPGGVGVLDGRHVRFAYVGDWVVRPYSTPPYVLPHEMFVRMYETC